MRKFPILPFITLVVALTLSSAVARCQDQSQSGESVADAARKAREQKKSAAKPKHVMTEDDIPSRLAPPPTTASQTSSADSVAPTAPPTTGDGKELAADKSEKKEDPNSEASWRKRFAAQRKRIADAQLELDVLQREAEKAGVQYYSDPQKALNEQYSRKEINDKTEKIEAKKKEIAALNQQLSDMEEELKRAGGDPGWSR